MSETPESSTPPAPVPPPPAFAAPPAEPDWLFRVAAWIAIVAGIVFIAVAVSSAVCWYLWCR